MRVIVFVNHIGELGYRQTTALLIAAIHNQNHDVYLADVDSITCIAHTNSTRFVVNCLGLKQELNSGPVDSHAIEVLAKSSNSASLRSIVISEDDLIFIRTNPGRDEARTAIHKIFLELCQIAESRGFRVINQPAKLPFFASKSATAVLDSRYRPAMVASSDLNTIAEFVNDSGCQCIVKPLLGSRGKDVIRVSDSTDGLNSKLREQFGNRGVIAQHFVESDEPGDKRVVVLDGELLESDGHVAGIHRIPAEGDFRGNLHAGGTARELTLDSEQRAAVEHAAEKLNANGIRLAGIDIIASKVIEFNVFSTGGLYDANRFSNQDFATIVVDRLMSSVAARKSPKSET